MGGRGAVREREKKKKREEEEERMRGGCAAARIWNAVAAAASLANREKLSESPEGKNLDVITA
uniref:Uncharacterized protein n=1 Tax=Oryza brachyantha TaxID=4533 RepID=J3MD09_ORYBR